MAPIVYLDNIASQTALQAYVDNIKFESMFSTETATFQTANYPTHTVGDIVALQRGELQGIYQETGWSMGLAYNGLMQHTAKRVIL